MTSTDALSAYLNAHLAGSVGARELIKKVASNNEGTPCGEFLSTLLAAVEEEVGTLEGLMARCGIAKHPLKLAGGWVTERVTRLVFHERITGSAPLSRLLELESLSLGVTGQLRMWRALKEVAPGDTRFAAIDFDRLIGRVQDHLTGLERHRLAAAASAFSG